MELLNQGTIINIYHKFVSLFGPLISILCIVKDGSRHLERNNEAGFFVTSESNL